MTPEVLLRPLSCVGHGDKKYAFVHISPVILCSRATEESERGLLSPPGLSFGVL